MCQPNSITANNVTWNLKLVSKNPNQFTSCRLLQYFSTTTYQSSNSDSCHKNYFSLLPRSPHILARATRVVTLPCRHLALRAIQNKKNYLKKTLLPSPTSPSRTHSRSARDARQKTFADGLWKSHGLGLGLGPPITCKPCLHSSLQAIPSV